MIDASTDQAPAFKGGCTCGKDVSSAFRYEVATIGSGQTAHAAGIPIVINSDAHDPGEVGRDFDQAVRAAKAAGYTQVCRFARRQRTLVPLE